MTVTHQEGIADVPKMTGRVTTGDRVQQIAALDARIAGKTWDEVAAEAGYENSSNAARAVRALLKRVESETVEEYRALLDARLEFLWKKAYAAVDAAAAGSTVGLAQTLQSALRIIDRQAKLHGADMPVRVDATVTTRSDLDAEIEQLVARLTGTVVE